MRLDHPELQRIEQAYSKRTVRARTRYVEFVQADRERHYLAFLNSLGSPLQKLYLVELGCGEGGELLRLIDIGLSPDRLAGIELLPQRVAAAKSRLPATVRVVQGDATRCSLEGASFEVVFISTVFSSILDAGFRSRLADEAWRLVAPGGAVMVYDFTVNNPRNPDVRGIPPAEIRRLFPNTPITMRSTTLAPPIGRPLAKLGPGVYRLLASLPLLRTHLVSWIRKPR